MTARRAASFLRMVSVCAPLQERESSADVKPSLHGVSTLDWQGDVRLATDRAEGISAPAWQAQVRKSLLERALVLGADHCAGPHQDRPEAARRWLAHVDALAEAGLMPDDLMALSEEAELDHPGALWALALLFCSIDVSDAEQAFEAWIVSLDPSLFLTYRGISEIAGALRIQPNIRIRNDVARWLSSPVALINSIALEIMTPEQVSDEALARLGRSADPLVHVAIERFSYRSAGARERLTHARPSWIEMPVAALAYEAARARILAGDLEPILRLRQRDRRALEALGLHAMDVFALIGHGSDNELVADIARALPTTPGLLSAMGRAGLPSLFQRMLSDLENEDFDEDALDALVTALGDEGVRPPSPGVKLAPPAGSRAAWEQVIAALPAGAEPTRWRGGEPYSAEAVIREAQRPDLSAWDVRVRADELLTATRSPANIEWDAFGVSLEDALSGLARLVH